MATTTYSETITLITRRFQGSLYSSGDSHARNVTVLSTGWPMRLRGLLRRTYPFYLKCAVTLRIPVPPSLLVKAFHMHCHVQGNGRDFLERCRKHGDSADATYLLGPITLSRLRAVTPSPLRARAHGYELSSCQKKFLMSLENVSSHHKCSFLESVAWYVYLLLSMSFVLLKYNAATVPEIHISAHCSDEWPICSQN